MALNYEVRRLRRLHKRMFDVGTGMEWNGLAGETVCPGERGRILHGTVPE
jgi:hypothetical protein